MRRRGFGEPRVGDLKDLVLIAALYAPLVPSDTERVETLVDAAITKTYGDSKMARAARLSFGADRRTRGKGPTERHEAAWRELGGEGALASWRTDGTREMHEALAHGIIAIFSDGEIAVIPPIAVPREADAAPLAAVELPDQTAANDAASIEPPADRPQPDGKRLLPPAWAMVAIALMLVLVLVAAAIFLISGNSGHQSDHKPVASSVHIPPKGSVVRVSNGEVLRSDPAPSAPKTPAVLDGGGPIFRVCDLTIEPECEMKGGRNIFYVKAGDILKFVYILDNDGKSQIPYARLNISNGWTGLKENELNVFANIDWPERGKESVLGEHRVLLSANVRPAAIRYIPESTVLLDNGINLVGHLPDGITENNGIGLAQIGAPEQCFFNCTVRFIRFIEFKVEVIQSPYNRPVG